MLKVTYLISFYLPVESYVKSLEQPGLLDLVVVPTSEDVTMEDVEDLRPTKRKTIYSEVCYLAVATFWKLVNHNYILE